MFHRDCYQILLLNFRSSTETFSQEDSNLDNNRFFKRRNYRKILVNIGEFYWEHKFRTKSRLNLEKFGISNDIPARLGQDPILRVVCIIERTHFILSILGWNDSRQGGGLKEKLKIKTFPAAKSMCESSLINIALFSSKNWIIISCTWFK